MRRIRRADEHSMRTRTNNTMSCYRIIFALITILGEYVTLQTDLEQSSFLAKPAFNAPFWKLEALYRSFIYRHSDIIVFESPSIYKAETKTQTVVDRFSGLPCARRTELLAPGFRSPRDSRLASTIERTSVCLN
jgi:hypothetical protein